MEALVSPVSLVFERLIKPKPRIHLREHKDFQEMSLKLI